MKFDQKRWSYSQFHKTLPKSSLQMHWISVRFYEMGDTQNFIKDKMTGMIDIPWRISYKSAKKLHMKSKERINIVFGKLFSKKRLKIVLFYDFHFNFFCDYLNNASISTLPIILSLTFFVAQTSGLGFFSKG